MPVHVGTWIKHTIKIRDIVCVARYSISSRSLFVTDSGVKLANNKPQIDGLVADSHYNLHTRIWDRRSLILRLDWIDQAQRYLIHIPFGVNLV